MVLSVNTNVGSLNAQRNLERSSQMLGKSLERLSSGQRINHAGDDAAGLAISEGLTAQIRGMNQAVRNANDGISMIGTAESALNTYVDMLQRIRELAVQSANSTNSADNRLTMNTETSQLLSELQRISGTVQFNGHMLLDGTFTNKAIQVGANANETINLTLGNLQTNVLGMVASHTGTVIDPTVALGAGDLVINGTAIAAATADGISSVNQTGSAAAVANAINAKSAMTGVSASTIAATLSPGVAAIAGFTGDATHQLTINGVNIFSSGSYTVLANDSDSSLRNAINAKTNQTGVTATVDNAGKLVLTGVDGRNINVTTTGGAAGAGTGTGFKLGLVNDAGGNVTNLLKGGQITVSSANDIVITGNTPGTAGLGTTTYARDTTTSLSNLSLVDVVSSNQAITMVDNALTQIGNLRANIGAVTNRLQDTISNLQAISENMSSANSQIRDADFAAETATMTRSQILQQAGISILNQANATTQSAVKLLQG